MKKLFLLTSLFTSMLFLGCKKDNANKTTIDTTPKMVEVIFTTNHVASQIYYTLNEHSTSGMGINGTFESFKDNYQVKIGDTLTAHMFTGGDVANSYAIKIMYADKQLAQSTEVQNVNGNNHIDLTHVFTSDDFK